MGVAEPLRRPTASRGRKRPRAAARLVGTSRAACCRSRLRVNPFLFWFVSFWLLFSGVWETLIFGTGNWFAFGESFFCGLFAPTNPLPGHRLVPESHIYIYVCMNICIFFTVLLLGSLDLSAVASFSTVLWSNVARRGETHRDQCQAHLMAPVPMSVLTDLQLYQLTSCPASCCLTPTGDMPAPLTQAAGKII